MPLSEVGKWLGVLTIPLGERHRGGGGAAAEWPGAAQNGALAPRGRPAGLSRVGPCLALSAVWPHTFHPGCCLCGGRCSGSSWCCQEMLQTEELMRIQIHFSHSAGRRKSQRKTQVSWCVAELSPLIQDGTLMLCPAEGTRAVPSLEKGKKGVNSSLTLFYKVTDPCGPHLSLA